MEVVVPRILELLKKGRKNNKSKKQSVDGYSNAGGFCGGKFEVINLNSVADYWPFMGVILRLQG